ncbi:CRISPR-associated protein CasE [Peptostreptococcus sp. MV1]|uniref:type I-E CRISPR-associated protein Cas6/Cse3/CasE n=1 Tax=Peptostreptococcus sp. MV1 TaxID=1219626 RepID=UPI00051029CA|nr:type I-E CRISPR-associated protein Cas6/Cse3/CasE [Peptostreptococcus sp. MV1]KGF10376.1 CRISPR-associated protein CasE [Peptostreptococcus sp. MV1]
MYISRVEIDIENRRKIKNMSHVAAYHSWVEDSFPDEKNLESRTRKLWRIDKLNGKMYLLVVSQDKPDLACLERYGVEGTAASKSYDNFLNAIKNGESYRFRITLNPIISLSKGSGNKSLIKPHVTIEHQKKYLLDRSIKNGFKLDDKEFYIVERGYENFYKSGQKKIRLVKAVYEGILTVENIDLFKEVLTKGMGKKRAYGFGLMTVIPML